MQHACQNIVYNTCTRINRAAVARNPYATPKRLPFIASLVDANKAVNWWKITSSNRTTVHYGAPLQTVVNNCNPQFTRRTK